MRFAAAVALSVLVHGLLGVGFVCWANANSRSEVIATLDLSSVELSLAEEDSDAPAIVPQEASVASESLPQRMNDVEPMPQVETTSPDAPTFETAPLPEPTPSRETFDSRDAIRPQKPTSAPVPAAPAVAPRQARVDAPPRPRTSIRPDYPKGSRQRGEEGAVVVEITVTARGAVESVRIVTSSGYPELDEAAVKAVRTARFSPAKSGSDAVASTARLKLEFQLKGAR